MAKFKFKLRVLLKVRQSQEQQLQRDVAAIERQRVGIETTLREQQQQIMQSKLSLQERLVGKVDAQHLRMEAAMTMNLMRRAQSLVLELAGVHRRLETARTKLLDAARARRAIEMLRDRRFAAWKAQMEKQEGDVIDELAINSAPIRSRQWESMLQE